MKEIAQKLESVISFVVVMDKGSTNNSRKIIATYREI